MKRVLAIAFLLSTIIGCGEGSDFVVSDSPLAPSGPSLVAGQDYALSFDGVDDYATTGTARFPLMMNPQTVSLWAWYPTTEGTQVMVVLRADFESGLALGIVDNTVAAWNVYGPRVLAAADSTPTVDTWHHLAYVFDGTTHTFYVDGVPAGTGTREPGHRTPFLCWLGTLDGTSQFYRGRLDQVRIWKRARSTEEIGLDLSGKAGVDDPDLVAYWRFDAAAGARMPDDSGNGNLVSLGAGDPQRIPEIVRVDIPCQN